MFSKSPIFIIVISLLPLSFPVFSQVGIGTTSPSAELEIETTNTGIPALELNPQTTPVGDTMGQLAVIGDILYMYDDVRDKWLSVESTALQFGYSLTADNQFLFFGGDSDLIGAEMPFDGTIVYMTIESSGGNTTKSFDIYLNSTRVPNSADETLDGRISLSSGSFLRTTYNINFNARDNIRIQARSNGTGVDDPTAILWVKWRQ